MQRRPPLTPPPGPGGSWRSPPPRHDPEVSWRYQGLSETSHRQRASGTSERFIGPRLSVQSVWRTNAFMDFTARSFKSVSAAERETWQIIYNITWMKDEDDEDDEGR